MREQLQEKIAFLRHKFRLKNLHELESSLIRESISYEIVINDIIIIPSKIKMSYFVRYFITMTHYDKCELNFAKVALVHVWV